MLRNCRFVNMYYTYYLHKVIPITFIRLCLLPTGNRYFYLHHIDTSICII
nr:MAG TPA: hypothetical protein [Caudoviricetes sp.]